MTKDITQHISVMSNEVLQAFAEMKTLDQPIFLDGTLGGGGHTAALLNEFPRALVVACDQDTAALARAQVRLAQYSDRLVLEHVNFGEVSDRLPEIIANISKLRSAPPTTPFDGILLDVGLSSDQLDDAQRGFSFQHDGPLDMRMDQTQTKTAADILNSSEPADLSRMFQRGGMRRGVKELVQAVLRSRPFTTTREFADVCSSALARFQYDRKSSAHLATVPFQCLRIAVNDELGALERLLTAIPLLLRQNGRVCVISFHSLEDRVVTSAFRRWEQKNSPRFLPIQGDEQTFGRLLTPHAITPSAEELSRNPRARSARMRIFQRGEEGSR